MHKQIYLVKDCLPDKKMGYLLNIMFVGALNEKNRSNDQALQA